jgi:UDP-3-O-[3-hydroxymyristoyl] N-acetylglucosamine deacetylase
MSLDPSSQWTLARPFELEGIGLHSGKTVRLTLHPAPPDSGIRFVRSDLPGRPEIPALAEFVVETTLSTTLGVGSAKVQTVEHLMAALWSLGIANATIVVDGAEMPALDGSARVYVDHIHQAGRVMQDAARPMLELDTKIEIDWGEKSIFVQPAKLPEVTYVVDYGHPLAGPQLFESPLSEAVFETEIAAARTFCLLSEVEAMRKMGLAKGGSTENAVVIADYRYLSPLRYPDEFVRHKVLDLIGDLALTGSWWVGQVVAAKAGHALHVALARKLRERALSRKEKPHAPFRVR